jgi:hypothetical protein
MQTITHRLAEFANGVGFVQTGESWRVQIAPDLFTGERLNIGVGVRSSSGAVKVRVMDFPGRLVCFYGDIGAENILFAAKLYKEAVEAGLLSPVKNIIETDRQPIYNTDPDEALVSLFNDQVSAGRIEQKGQKNDETVKREKLTADIYRIIRKARPDDADSIIPQSPMTIVQTKQGNRAARIPIQGETAFAGLESAAIKTSHVIQFNLMNALLDVEAACRAKQVKRMGMFILRPETLDMHWNTMVDNAIDRILWRAPNRCHFVADAKHEVLAEKIIDFAMTRRAA